MACLPQEGATGTGYRVRGTGLSSSTAIPTSPMDSIQQGIVKVRFSGFSCSLRKRCSPARFAAAMSPAKSASGKNNSGAPHRFGTPRSIPFTSIGRLAGIAKLGNMGQMTEGPAVDSKDLPRYEGRLFRGQKENHIRNVLG